MEIKCPILVLVLLMFFNIPLKEAKASDQSNPLQSSNILNPKISVNAWFQGEGGHREGGGPDQKAVDLKEVEIGFQSNVDSYAKADFFIGIKSGEVDIEEGYIDWYRLPYDTAIKVGKFKTNLGKFNRIHGAETPFATRPFMQDAYFGEEGLAGPGGSLNWHIPNPAFLTSLNLEVIETPEGVDVPGFDRSNKNNMTGIGRLGTFIEGSEAASWEIGLNYAMGPAGQEFNSVFNSSTTLTSQFYGFDLTFHWKNPRRAIYKSILWQTEVFWNDRELSSIDSNYSVGLFSYIDFQFARRWKTGIRADYAESPVDKNTQEQGGLMYLTFMPSEFSLISLQGQHKNLDNNVDENLAFLKVTFNIGPHGTHPF